MVIFVECAGEARVTTPVESVSRGTGSEGVYWGRSRGGRRYHHQQSRYLHGQIKHLKNDSFRAQK